MASLTKLTGRMVVVVAIVLLLAVVAVRALDSPSSISYFRAIDEHTLVVGTAAGPGAWTRVTSVVETPSTVTVTVSSLFVRLGPGTSEAVLVESSATLHDALANRTVIDGSSGLAVQRTHCLPPAYLAPECTP